MFSTTCDLVIFAAKQYIVLSKDLLYSCQLCPHRCGVDRSVEVGYCNTGAIPLVSSVFQHKGEEPVLSGNLGVCNVFFAHCNLQCVYCQNHQISCNSLSNPLWHKSIDEIVNSIMQILDKGVRILGFVSPSHQVVQMVEILDALHRKGYFPTVVYNTNCYDNVAMLKDLEDVVDVYLPDFKYGSNELGLKYSGVSNYFDVAKLALKEMFRQKGASLIINDDGLAEFGLIVRPLVLPGNIKESLGLLRFLSDEISPRLYISLMSQYYPPNDLSLPKPLDRILNTEEYKEVIDVLDEIGFRGWAQSIESNSYYKPDFNSNKPFVS
jgi:putative pyruvate formate lyase activating enzyme